MGSPQQKNVFYFTMAALIFITSSAAEGQLRLAGSGSTQCSGRVEIFYNNTWGTVCDDDWDLNDATVVCRQLSCGAPQDAPRSALFGEGSGRIWLKDVACSGSERSLIQCQHSGFGTNMCDHNEDAGVMCSGVPVRLIGPTLFSGRVEIRYNNIWGTVCDNGWDISDASVVCRELGYGAALAASHLAVLGEGNGQIWLDNVTCSGSEGSLTQCRHRRFGQHNCTHAGVTCSGVPLRLAGPSLCSGRVEIYNNTWATVCGEDWDLNDAAVVCRDLGCGGAQKALPSIQFGKTTSQTWLNGVACSGSESSLTQCQHRGFGTNICTHAGVTCSVILPKPSIYTHPAGGEVTWGQDISISCSISIQTRQLLRGTFTLDLISGSFSQNKTSDTNCATFTITKVSFDNEGLYRCLFSQGTRSQQGTVISDSVKLSVGKKVSLWLLVSSASAGILLLLMLLLLLVCLVRRRRQQASQPGTTVQKTMTAMNDCEEEEDEEEMIYVNVDPVNMNKNRDQAVGIEEQESDCHDYEEALTEHNHTETAKAFVTLHNRGKQIEEDIWDDENDYVNATQPFYEQTVEIYAGDECIYNNI